MSLCGVLINCARELEPCVVSEDVVGDQRKVGVGEREASTYPVGPFGRLDSCHDFGHLLLQQVRRFGD